MKIEKIPVAWKEVHVYSVDELRKLIAINLKDSVSNLFYVLPEANNETLKYKERVILSAIGYYLEEEGDVSLLVSMAKNMGILSGVEWKVEESWPVPDNWVEASKVNDEESLNRLRSKIEKDFPYFSSLLKGMDLSGAVKPVKETSKRRLYG